MALSQTMWVGEVDRISGSGNAMVVRESIKHPDRTESPLPKEVNLGPLPRGVVGEEVQFAYQEGTYGLCLDFQYIDEEYLKEMEGRRSLDLIEIELGDLLTDVDIPEMVDTGDLLVAEYLLSYPPKGPLIDIQDGEHLAKISPTDGDEWSCLGLLEEPVLQNDIPVPVTVTKVHPGYVETKGAFPELDDGLPGVGETVTVITGSKNAKGTLALYESEYTIPVLIENVEYPSGESLEIQITAVKGTHLTGEAVFSADDFDVIHISNDEIPQGNRQSRNRVIKRGVPIDIEPVPPDATTTSGVIVTDEGPDALVGRWNIQDEIGPVNITKGDEIELEIRSVDGDSCIGYYERLPVQVNFNSAIPVEFEGEHFPVSIRAVHPDKAIAEPLWIREDQGALEVQIVGATVDDAFAIEEGHPVRIPNSSVVKPGDQVHVGLSKSKDNDEITATVSSRPVFRDSDGPYLIRLPHTRGDVVHIDGTPVVVDHLPDVDAAVTLGIAEVNEDHIVPTISALPESHLPDEGTYISAALEEIVDDTVIGVGKELLLKLPLFSAVWDDLITARVIERHSESLFGVVGNAGGDTSDQLWLVYELVQLAGLALQQSEYRDAAGHLNEALESCPSKFPVLERLLAVHETSIQAILAIRDSGGFEQTAESLSQEENRLSEFNQDGGATEEINTFLSARQAEMRAAERLLTALDEVDSDTTSNLQAIARGVSARPPAVEAAEHLKVAEENVAGTPFEEQIPSLELQSVIREFEDSFPGIVDELRPFSHPEEDANWFLYLLPDEILKRTEATPSNLETGGNTWQRPAVPETMGIVPVTDLAGDEATPINNTEPNHEESEPLVGPKSHDFDGITNDTTESNQAEVPDPQDSAIDGEPPATEPEQTATITEGEASEPAATAEADSNRPSAKIETDEQTSVDEDTPQVETETPPDVEATSGKTKGEPTRSKIPDEHLSIPDDSFKLRKLREQAEAEASENPELEHVETTTSRYRRSSAIREYALERAGGNCELCGGAAPFVKPDGEPFLEVHHVDELGEGGADHPSLVGAVCPNCHKEIHHGKHGEDLNEHLRERLEEGLGDVGATDG